MASTAERILLVESDPDISELIAKQALRPLGYEVKIVDQASAAIEEALTDPPDLIIADLNLPDLSGKDVLAAISAKGVKAPLVVIAGKGEERRAIQAFRLGAVDAILWPVKDAEVVQVVERSIQPTRSRRIRRQLYQQLLAFQDELKRRGRDLAAFVSLGKSVSSGLDQRQFFGSVVDAALEISAADVAWLLVWDEPTRNYVLRAHRNLPPAWAKKLNQPLDDGLSSTVTRSGRALTIQGAAMEKFKVASLGRSAAVVPIRSKNETLAVLIVVRKADAEFDRGAQALLQGVADLASASLLNARLFRALEAAGTSVRLSARNRARLQESLRASVDELSQVLSGKGELTKDQRAALNATQASLQKLVRSTDKAATMPLPPRE